MSDIKKPYDENPRARYDWLSQVSLGATSGEPLRHRAWRRPHRTGPLEAGSAHGQPTAARAIDDRGEQQPVSCVQRWSCLGPENAGGRIRSIIIHPRKPNILFAGAATGGVWRTDDEGGSWQPLMSEQRSLAIGALAIDPRDPDILYAGTGEPYVRLVFSGIGILKSTDGGARWEEIGPSPMTRISRIVIDPQNTASIFCAGAEGLFHSRDEGKSWEQLTFGDITDLKMTPEGTLFVGVYGVGLFKKEKDEPWEQLGAGAISRPRYRPLLAIGRCSGCAAQMLYTRIDSEVYSSHDGGRHWSNLGPIPLQDADPDWASCIVSHPLRPNQIFVGGVTLGFFQTGCGDIPAYSFVDCVRRKEPDSDGDFHDQHDLAFHPEDPNIIYVANDQGVFRSTDGGIVWSKRSRGLITTQFYSLAVSPHDPNVLGGGAQDRGTWVRRRSGWVKIAGLDGGPMAFDPIDSNIVWCQQQGNDIQKVYLDPVPGRKTVQSFGHGLDGPAPFIGALVTLKVGNDRMLLTGRQYVFVEEPDGPNPSSSWKEASVYLKGECSAIAVDAVNKLIFAGTANGFLWCGPARPLTKDSDDLWGRMEPTLKGQPEVPKRPINRIVLADTTRANEKVVYVCFSGFNEVPPFFSAGLFSFVVDTTAPVPMPWHNRSGRDSSSDLRLPNVACHGLAIQRSSKTETFYACTDIGVYRSCDGGDTWHDFSDGLPNVPCFDIHLYQPDDTSKPGLLRVATHGRGIWEIEV